MIYKQDLHREHVDHDGSNKLDNCAPSCRSCNSSKYNKEIDDWYNESNEYFTIERLQRLNSWRDSDHKKYLDRI